MKRYDVIVIGSGGGAKIASPAAGLGLKVAVVEKDRLGGTCLNRGCIPSKMLIHPADVAQEIREARRFDILNDPEFTVDFEKLVTRISGTVDHDSDGIAASYAKNPNIDYFHGTARFVSNYVLEVNAEQLTAPKIFIAVGTRPSVPAVPGLEGTPFWTSTEALRNTRLPKKLIVIGASYIAVELGHAYGALGSEVDFVVRSRFLRREDGEAAAEFSRVFMKKYRTHQGFKPREVSHDGQNFKVTVADGQGRTEDLRADALLVATGITSNADTLGLERTDIRTGETNFVEVDDCLMTAVDGVYAFGDCIGRYFFRHSANFEGEYLLRTVFVEPAREPIDYPPVPHAVFSSPQVAGVGLTEEECRRQNIGYVAGVNPYEKSAMGMARLSDHGFCKLIFEKASRRLIGAHVVGPEASDLIHMPIAYMTMKATLDDMLATIYIHPALPEIVRNAARRARMALDGSLLGRPESKTVKPGPGPAGLKW